MEEDEQFARNEIDTHTYMYTYKHINLCTPEPSGMQQREVQESPVTEGKWATTCSPERVESRWCNSTIDGRQQINNTHSALVLDKGYD